VKTGVVSKNESGADFQARLKGLYGQTNEPDKEHKFIALPKEWNRSDPTLVVTEAIRQGSKLYRLEKSNSLVDCGLSSQSKASNLHDRVQNLYEQVEQPEMEGADMESAKVWKSQMTWNPMDSKVGQ